MRFGKTMLVLCSLLVTACGGQSNSGRVFAPHYEPTTRSATIRFVGDVMQHKPQIDAAWQDGRYDYTSCFAPVATLLSEADLTIANLETTLRTTPPFSGYPLFAAPSELAAALADAGVDVALLANNHICDRGGKGLRSTIGILDSLGIAHTGAFADLPDYARNNPLSVKVGGFNIAIMNYTYGTNGMPTAKGTFVNRIDTTRIALDMQRARTADIRLVCIHWGQEYAQRPHKAERQLAEWLYQKGATAIIGGHPHVMQPVEIRSDRNGTTQGVTFYSLGNFVSNQIWEATDGGMVATLHFEQTDNQPLRITPSWEYVWVHKRYENGRLRYSVLPLHNHEQAVTDSTQWRLRRFERLSRKFSTADTVIVQ
ncbi:MAG: CapA family protein [Rikenellaceae bacterium]|nr:CapA family protein [Rikenellaceae bacterium]